MPHELDRLVAAASRSVWLIEPDKAEELLAVLDLRLRAGPDAVRAEGGEAAEPKDRGAVRVIPLHGPIVPRASLLGAMSGASSLQSFRSQLADAAEDDSLGAIVLDVDSPGGQVDMVQETASAIREARRPGRPIVAVANTRAASAAYWIASAADELVVTPSGRVGSIGVYGLHQDLSQRLRQEGIAPTFIFEGPRKVEGNPFAPLDPVALAALQQSVRETYEAFTSDVAAFRGVPVDRVRADPEAEPEHFGGGRAYGAREAVRLGMADAVATLDQTIARLAEGPRRRTRNPRHARRRLALA